MLALEPDARPFPYSISHPHQSLVHTGIPKRTSTKGQLSHFNTTFLLTLHIASTHIKEYHAHMPYVKQSLPAESGMLDGAHRCAFIQTLSTCMGQWSFLGLPLYCTSYVKGFLFLTHLTTQLQPVSCVILSPLLCVESSYHHDFNLKMLASYLFL